MAEGARAADGRLRQPGVRARLGGRTDGAADYALRTDGLVEALRACGGLGTPLACIRLVPRAWRDGAYRLVARFRHRLFGEWKPRPLAKPGMGARFIGGPA